jgi:hypothetical protein
MSRRDDVAAGDSAGCIPGVAIVDLQIIARSVMAFRGNGCVIVQQPPLPLQISLFAKEHVYSF